MEFPLPGTAAKLLEMIVIKIFRSAGKVYRPVRNWIGAGILAIFVLMVAAVVQVYPLANWDMVAYTASVLESDIEDHVELHTQSYKILKENVSDGEFLQLTQDRTYRIRQYEDPRAFSTMLGFYRLKLLYVETARALTAFVNPIEALRLISIGSAIAVGGILLIWLARNNALCYGPVVVAMLVLNSFGGAAALLSPDLYASVFLLLAALFYIERQDLPAAAALMIAFFIRPDHLAFIGVFFVFAAIYGPGRWVMTGCFALCFAGYVVLTRDATHPGWWVHMWFTHVEYVPTLEGFEPPFTILAYLKMLVRSTVRSLINQNWLALLFVLAVFFFKVIDPKQIATRTRALLYAVFVSICAKYLVFPHYETRFYFPYLMTMGMILLVAWHQQSTKQHVR